MTRDPPRPGPLVTVAGVPIHALTLPEAVEHIVGAAKAGRGGRVITPNVDQLRQASRREEIATLFSEDPGLVLADGMPVVWASCLQGTPLPGRVPGSSLIWTLAEAAAGSGLSCFLLGGNPGSAESAAETLREHFAGLEIAGTLCPPLGFENDHRQLAALRRELINCQPSIVFVALGFPKQDLLARRLAADLPETWFLGVGISFSFVSGDIERAPAWLQRVGLEWVHRLVQEPRRLARRYLIDDIPFAIRLIARSMAIGLRARLRPERPGT